MSLRDFLQLLIFLALLALVSLPLSEYLRKTFSGERTWLSRPCDGLTRALEAAGGLNTAEEQNWTSYFRDLLVFSAMAFLFTWLVLLFQADLPWNPTGLPGMSWHLALNTAVSFATNTDWQSYSGESTLSPFSQMVGLVLQNFVSAAVGLSAAVAVVRGLSRRQSGTVGNFWSDIIRSVVHILLPLSLIYAVFLVSQGVVQSLSSGVELHTLEGERQWLPLGPVASQVAIKMLGTNGGGFFNANAAHPFENPTALSNFVQVFSIFLLPSALVLFAGRMFKNIRHAWTLWTLMALVFSAGAVGIAYAEAAGAPWFEAADLASRLNLEGKELRFGNFGTALFAAATTDASAGATNAAMGSLTPLGALIPLVNILLGEIIFGGIGSGLYGMLLYVILTVFLAGLMVGRTPEYLGKKIEAWEVKLCSLAIIVTSFALLGFSAVAAATETGRAGLGNPAARGFTELFYAFASATNNNGSAMAGLNANTPFFNLSLSFAMLVGRFVPMGALLAVAASLGAKTPRPESQSSFPLHGVMFGLLLFGVIAVVGALTFFPALALGPVVEHFQLLSGKSF